MKIITLDLGGVNAYLIRTEDSDVLVDTGGHMMLDKEYDDRCDLLMKKLKEADCDRNRLKLLLLTHGDVDHAGNATFIKETMQVPVAVHKADEHMIKHPELEDMMASFKFRSPVLRLIARLINSKIEKVMLKTKNDFKTVQPDVYLDKKFNLDEYGIEGSIIHMPGHTKGSVGILIDDNLICGDSFANQKKPEMAGNAQDFNQLKESCLKVKKLHVRMVYPGHGEPFKVNWN